MAEPAPLSANSSPALEVAAGQDRFGEHRGLGVSTIDFKVVPRDSEGVSIIENAFHAKGGPARHAHVEPDEHVGEARGRILISFLPAGSMEAFFREVTKANAMPPLDPALWRAHGVGPPLQVT